MQGAVFDLTGSLRPFGAVFGTLEVLANSYWFLEEGEAVLACGSWPST